MIIIHTRTTHPHATKHTRASAHTYLLLLLCANEHAELLVLILHELHQRLVLSDTCHELRLGVLGLHLALLTRVLRMHVQLRLCWRKESN